MVEADGPENLAGTTAAVYMVSEARVRNHQTTRKSRILVG
jgi:hypothetical protein